MNTETETLVSVLNSRMEKMTPDERLDLLADIANGYCTECGYAQPLHGSCKCWNDE